MRRLSVSALLATTLIAACHRSAAAPALTPVQAPESHCFWTAFRTTLPPDTVASRYARAFTTLGLTGAVTSHAADTAWAHAGPTPLTLPNGSGTYAARVVAFRRGDTTYYRPFVSLTADRQAAGEDSGRHTSRTIYFCGALAGAAQVHGVTQGRPGALEAMDVWRARPE